MGKSPMLYLCRSDMYTMSAWMALIQEDGNHIVHLVGAGEELMGWKV